MIIKSLLINSSLSALELICGQRVFYGGKTIETRVEMFEDIIFARETIKEFIGCFTTSTEGMDLLYNVQRKWNNINP